MNECIEKLGLEGGELEKTDQSRSCAGAYGDGDSDGEASASRGTEPAAMVSHPLDTFERVDSTSARDYNNYFQQVDQIYSNYTNTFEYYKFLILKLLKIEGLKLLPLFELAGLQPSHNEIYLGLRHDIDADPLTGLDCARFLTSNRICGSFYLLHTSPYYGDFYGPHFLRNPNLKDWIAAFVTAGSELGVHNDCLHIFEKHNLNGAQALVTEIAWLRAVGANIRGTVAHNSGPIYGAENFEIFSHLKLWSRPLLTNNGKHIPLGCLSANELHLDYEGTFSVPKREIDRALASHFFANPSISDVRSPTWMGAYLLDNPACDSKIDFQFWLVNNNCWVIAGRYEDRRIFEFGVPISKMLSVLVELPKGSKSIMVLHPEYFRDIGRPNGF